MRALECNDPGRSLGELDHGASHAERLGNSTAASASQHASRTEVQFGRATVQRNRAMHAVRSCTPALHGRSQLHVSVGIPVMKCTILKITNLREGALISIGGMPAYPRSLYLRRLEYAGLEGDSKKCRKSRYVQVAPALPESPLEDLSWGTLRSSGVTWTTWTGKAPTRPEAARRTTCGHAQHPCRACSRHRHP